MAASYTYDPANLSTSAVDRMRFELGDVNVSNGGNSAYLSDEEIKAAVADSRSWSGAKLALVRHLLFRFSYEVNTKVGALSLELRARVDFWRKLYDDLINEEASAPPDFKATGRRRPPIFRIGIHDSREGGPGYVPASH